MVMMPRIYQVDAFTSQPFSGNPAAVCLLEEAADPRWMQNVAAEMNLAETAFVVTCSQPFGLRWFTPLVEVDLCGHATLASAHVLWESGEVPSGQPCFFDTKSGELIARPMDGGIQLDFPAAPVRPVEAPVGLATALGVPLAFVGLSPFDYFVEVESADTVRQLQPDMNGLRKLGGRGVIVTSEDESGEFDFVSRFFGPAVGIDEDPVTGSAHCSLGPYWMDRLGQNVLQAWQASPRGGGMQVIVEDQRVKLLGDAVTVLRGEWCARPHPS
jgi:PhzF family phenazine biosynthesis protein